MAVGAIGGASGISSHLQIQGAGQPQSQAPAQTQSGAKIDNDGDHDNSTPLSDAAEGKGSLVNLTA
jgi:hypothetical protein